MDDLRSSDDLSSRLTQPVHRILFASLIGTTIEFYDFYIYATAAVLVFPTLFFPKGEANTAMLQSFATFALAFFARPVGSALFGHFGDRIGRKATLVTALLTMGVSTVAIGVLPTYASIGVAAAVLLSLCRFGQGLGLGGEWGGAVLLATENAPRGKEAWYGCFPQLGAPLGFICSTATFLSIGGYLGNDAFVDWGWRLPFIASAVLVLLGLYIRLQLVETPAFRRSVQQGERVRVPFVTVVLKYPRELVLGILGATTTFLIFYLMTVFSLSWATTALKFPRAEYLILQMLGVLFFGLFIPVSALIADRIGARRMLIIATLGLMLFGFCFQPLLSVRDTGHLFGFLALGFSLTGLTYGPLGSALAGLFPTAVRYTGTSLSFNFAGILGASLAPLIATHLSTDYGLPYVGYYLTVLGFVTLVALLLLKPPS